MSSTKTGVSQKTKITVAKLSNGRIVELVPHDTTVCFSEVSGWSLVYYQLRSHWSEPYWVKSTSVVWVMEF